MITTYMKHPPRFMTMPRFAMWLLVQDRRARVGVPETVCDCPIAKWLADTGIMPAPQVCGFDVASYTDSIDHETRCRRWPTPKWAGKFITLIDRTGLKYITAGRAMDILDQCA